MLEILSHECVGFESSIKTLFKKLLKMKDTNNMKQTSLHPLVYWCHETNGHAMLHFRGPKIQCLIAECGTLHTMEQMWCIQKICFVQMVVVGWCMRFKRKINWYTNKKHSLFVTCYFSILYTFLYAKTASYWQIYDWNVHKMEQRSWCDERNSQFCVLCLPVFFSLLFLFTVDVAQQCWHINAYFHIKNGNYNLVFGQWFFRCFFCSSCHLNNVIYLYSIVLGGSKMRVIFFLTNGALPPHSFWGTFFLVPKFEMYVNGPKCILSSLVLNKIQIELSLLTNRHMKTT